MAHNKLEVIGDNPVSTGNPMRIGDWAPGFYINKQGDILNKYGDKLGGGIIFYALGGMGYFPADYDVSQADWHPLSKGTKIVLTVL